MTDEEKAEEYVENKYHCNRSECIQGNSCDYCYREGSKRDYLAGLAEGKPKWHDLRKNPNDLPETPNWCHCVSIPVLNQDGIKVMYNYIRETWHFARRRNQYETCKVIAWCELPKFEE